MRRLAAASRLIDSLNETIGRGVLWLAVALVLVQFAVVVLRYVFGTSFIRMQESVLYLHATLFMLGIAYTLLHDGHVRVDVFYSELSPRAQALIDLVGTVVAVLPFCLLLLWVTIPFIVLSWRMREGAMFVGGWEAVYLLKTLIPIFAVLLLLQGISIAIRAVLVLRGLEPTVFPRRDAGAHG